MENLKVKKENPISLGDNILQKASIHKALYNIRC